MKETTKIKHSLACLFFCMWCLHSEAQVPVEITAGHSTYYYQHMFSGKIIAEKPFGFFNTSSILLPYDKKRGIEVMSQSYLTYEINKRWATGLGSIYAPGNRFVPSAFVWYFNKKKDLSYLIFTRMDVWSNPSFELFGSVEYQGSKNQDFNLYARLQLQYITSMHWNGHLKSVQYARLGVDNKGVQYGLGVNFDQYGPNTEHYSNFGLFVRRVF